MIEALSGGPKFLSEMLRVQEFDSKRIFEQINLILMQSKMLVKILLLSFVIGIEYTEDPLKNLIQ